MAVATSVALYRLVLRTKFRILSMLQHLMYSSKRRPAAWRFLFDVTVLFNTSTLGRVGERSPSDSRSVITLERKSKEHPLTLFLTPVNQYHYVLSTTRIEQVRCAPDSVLPSPGKVFIDGSSKCDEKANGDDGTTNEINKQNDFAFWNLKRIASRSSTNDHHQTARPKEKERQNVWM